MSSPLSSIPSSSQKSQAEVVFSFQQLPPAILLLSLPKLLIQPPNHRHYVTSLNLSITALRKCLALNSLNPDIECRAWTALAEIGMKIIGGGFSQSDSHPWAVNMESEVETATTKGLLIAQKHPSLRQYRAHLTILGADLALWQHNYRYARKTLRKLLSTFAPVDPPHIVYLAHLALIHHLNTPISDSAAISPRATSRNDIHATLAAIQDLQVASVANEHPLVTILAHVLRLRTLLHHSMWDKVSEALAIAEEALGLDFTPPSQKGSPGELASSNTTPKPVVTPPKYTHLFEANMVIHTLIIGVIYYTHAGVAGCTPRLTHLHALLDSNILNQMKCGDVDIPFPSSPPLSIQMTHPVILLLTVYLVSSVAKRDVVGRKPKRKVFAAEGLARWEEKLARQPPFLPWAGMHDVHEVAQRMARLKGDLLSEITGVCIMRSEFDLAEIHLDQLIAHTRTYEIFSSFAPRITLHHAHMAHAAGNSDRALECYRVAAHLANLQGAGESAGQFVAVAAKAGEAALLFGLQVGEERNEEVRILGAAVAKACVGMGSALSTSSHVLAACLCKEILKAKHHLKQALGCASSAQDNHSRALILALTASHYFHTSNEHAIQMLQVCETLAAGLGAAPRSTARKQDTFGNVALRKWVGERFLELYKRSGNEEFARNQARANAKFLALHESTSAVHSK